MNTRNQAIKQRYRARIATGQRIVLCDCGNRAIALKHGDPICARCLELEKQYNHGMMVVTR